LPLDDQARVKDRLAAMGRALRPLVASVDRRRRNRRGRALNAEPASINSLRQQLLEADRGLGMHAWLLASDLESPRRQAEVRRLAEQAMDPAATEEEVGQRVEQELDRRERAQREREAAVIEGREPGATAQAASGHLAGLELLAESLHLEDAFLERMLTTGDGWEPFAWLVDGLWPTLRRLHDRAVRYYGVPDSEVWGDEAEAAR